MRVAVGADEQMAEKSAGKRAVCNAGASIQAVIVQQPRRLFRRFTSSEGAYDV